MAYLLNRIPDHNMNFTRHFFSRGSALYRALPGNRQVSVIITAEPYVTLKGALPDIRYQAQY